MIDASACGNSIRVLRSRMPHVLSVEHGDQTHVHLDGVRLRLSPQVLLIVVSLVQGRVGSRGGYLTKGAVAKLTETSLEDAAEVISRARREIREQSSELDVVIPDPIPWDSKAKVWRLHPDLEVGIQGAPRGILRDLLSTLTEHSSDPLSIRPLVEASCSDPKRAYAEDYRRAVYRARLTDAVQWAQALRDRALFDGDLKNEIKADAMRALCVTLQGKDALTLIDGCRKRIREQPELHLAPACVLHPSVGLEIAEALWNGVLKPQAAVRCVEQARENAERLGDAQRGKHATWLTRAMRSLIYWVSGIPSLARRAWDEAESLLTDSEGQPGLEFFNAIAGVLLGTMLAEQTSHQGLQAIMKAEAKLESTGVLLGRGFWQALRSDALYRSGRRGEARQVLKHAKKHIGLNGDNLWLPYVEHIQRGWH